MLKIGLTGGIGTGKTTLAKIFEKLGIPVYYADDRAKEIMQTDPGIVRQIKALLGDDAYRGKRLNTEYIAGIVFNDKDKLSKLEAIVHPAVRKDFLDWVAWQDAKCVVVENAILHKSGMDKLVDFIIVVIAGDKIRMERLKKRDGKSEKALKKIINNQKTERKLLKNNVFFIENDGDINILFNKASKLLMKLKKKC